MPSVTSAMLMQCPGLPEIAGCLKGLYGNHQKLLKQLFSTIYWDALPDANQQCQHNVLNTIKQ